MSRFHAKLDQPLKIYFCLQYKDRRIERQQSRATAIQGIIKYLEQPYKAPPMGLSTPFLPRPGCKFQKKKK